MQEAIARDEEEFTEYAHFIRWGIDRGEQVAEFSPSLHPEQFFYVTHAALAVALREYPKPLAHLGEVKP